IRRATSILAMNNLPETNSFANGTSLHDRRRNPHRATRDQLARVRAHTLGRTSHHGRPFSPRLFSGALLFVLARAAVGDGASRFHLLTDGGCQHQWDWSLLHP